MGQDVIMDKKNPRIMRGEDRDGVYGKEKRDTELLLTLGTTHCLQ